MCRVNRKKPPSPKPLDDPHECGLYCPAHSCNPLATFGDVIIAPAKFPAQNFFQFVEDGIRNGEAYFAGASQLQQLERLATPEVEAGNEELVSAVTRSTIGRTVAFRRALRKSGGQHLLL